MKTIKYITNYSLWMACALFAVLFAACDDNDTPEQKVTRMAVTGLMDGTISLIEGDTYATAIATLPEEAVDASEYAYQYTSGNTKVFTVNESGVITATGVGEAVLKVLSTNNTDLWTTCLVKVEKRIYPVTDITFSDIYQDYYVGVERMIKLGQSVKVLPENASNADVVYSSSDSEIAEVNEYGEVYTKGLGDVKITVKATDGSGVSATCDIHIRNVEYTSLLERTGWTVTASHPYAVDPSAGGEPEKLIDGSTTSVLSLVKPGKAVGDISVGANESVFFLIDMKTPQTFDFFKLCHRTSNTSANLRVKKVSVYGSNDGENFTEIQKGIDITTSINEVTVALPVQSTFQYFKMTYDAWASGGNTMQISEFNIGNMTFLDND